MKTDETPEIIEIIDDDNDDAFGDRAPSHTMHDTGGPRWIGPAAGLALVALIGYGVATSGSSNDKPKASPVTSTTETPATTVAVTSTTKPVRAVPYHAFAPPPEFALAYAADMSVDDIGFDSGPYQLWSTPNATATSGSWFSIAEDAFSGGQIYADNAYRTLAGDVIVAISRTPDGQTTSRFIADGGSAVTITSHGWDDTQLTRLIESVQAGGGLVSFTDSWFMDDHRLVSTIHPLAVIQGKPQAQLGYASTIDPNRALGLRVGRQLTSDEGRYVLDLSTALRYFLERITPFEVNGHQAIAGTLPGSGELALASWVDGDAILNMVGSVPIPQLIAAARTARQVSADEWEAITLQATTVLGDDPGTTFEEGPVLKVASGTDVDGRSWTISSMVFSVTARDGTLSRRLSWQNDNNSWSRAVSDDQIHVASHTDDSRTYITADLPRAIAATAELHITRVGLEPVVVPFTDVDPALDRTLAAHAFSEPVPFTADVVASDGTVLASWPTP